MFFVGQSSHDNQSAMRLFFGSCMLAFWTDNLLALGLCGFEHGDGKITVGAWFIEWRMRNNVLTLGVFGARVKEITSSCSSFQEAAFFA